ncbi:MAG: ATP-dependent Clp protease proteolytic subunit [Clostridia bacterium]
MDNESVKKDDDSEGLQITTKNSRGNIHCITIAGQIEGHLALQTEQKATKYENIIPRLVAVEESDEIDGLMVLLNTAGGDVEAGLAIAEAIAGMSKPAVALVLGGAHSIGIPIAVSADKTFIAKSASMTIHPVRMTGMVIGVHQSFEHFKKIQDRIIDFVVEHSEVNAEQFRYLMLNTGELVSDIGTIVNGEEAVSIGLCDEVGTLGEALKCLHEMIDERSADINKDN